MTEYRKLLISYTNKGWHRTNLSFEQYLDMKGMR